MYKHIKDPDSMILNYNNTQYSIESLHALLKEDIINSHSHIPYDDVIYKYIVIDNNAFFTNIYYDANEQVLEITSFIKYTDSIEILSSVYTNKVSRWGIDRNIFRALILHAVDVALNRLELFHSENCS